MFSLKSSSLISELQEWKRESGGAEWGRGGGEAGPLTRNRTRNGDAEQYREVRAPAEPPPDCVGDVIPPPPPELDMAGGGGEGGVSVLLRLQQAL
jgi:hypothetical protein